MIRRLDHWIGTRLFHPPIIWLCQRTGMSQFAASAYAWLIATFSLVFTLRWSSGGQVALTAIVSLLAVIITVTTALFPDLPRRPSFAFRVFVWAITLLQCAHLVALYRATGAARLGWSDVWNACALVGEYAKTIRTIPPRKRRENHTAAKEAYS